MNHVRVEEVGPVRHVIISRRQKRNALSSEVYAAPDGIDAATAELVGELLANAPIAVGLTKRLLDVGAKPVLAATLEMEVTAQDTSARTADAPEGVAAVARKRTAVFTGR